MNIYDVGFLLLAALLELGAITIVVRWLSRKSWIIIVFATLAALVSGVGFISLQPRRNALQSQAKYLLGSYWTSLKAYQMETGKISYNAEEIGFQPEGEVRYLVAPNPNCPGVPQDITLKFVGIGPHATFKGDFDAYLRAIRSIPCQAGKEFHIVAVGNIDDDPDLDIWDMTEGKRLMNLHSDIGPETIVDTLRSQFGFFFQRYAFLFLIFCPPFFFGGLIALGLKFWRRFSMPTKH